MSIIDRLLGDDSLPDFSTDYYGGLRIPKFSTHCEVMRAIKKENKELSRKRSDYVSRLVFLKDAKRMMREPMDKLSYDTHLYIQGYAKGNIEDYLNSIEDVRGYYQTKRDKEFFIGSAGLFLFGLSCIDSQLFPYISSIYPSYSGLLEAYSHMLDDLSLASATAAIVFYSLARGSDDKVLETMREQIAATDIIPLEERSHIMEFTLHKIPKAAERYFERFRRFMLGNNYLP